jgi:SAM-dependent methyltransferase
MRWLRGRGLEIGAADAPTPLYGDARAAAAEMDLVLGTNAFNVEEGSPSAKRDTLDFVIAKHVLERCTSVARAYETLLRLVKPGGIVYIVTSQKPDQTPATRFDLQQHVAAYDDPLQLVTSPHLYTLADWTRLFLYLSQFYGPAATLEEATSDGEGMNCHFVLRRSPPSGTRKAFDFSPLRLIPSDDASDNANASSQPRPQSKPSEPRSLRRSSGIPETMSMRWLRGHGMEIGAGRNPTPLFGDTSCVYADIRTDTSFGGAPELVFDLEAEAAEGHGAFDFIIASHVLEHCDSLIRAIANLTNAVTPTGVVYIVLPDKRYLNDQNWMPDFNFDHHIQEWRDPLANAELHDRLFTGSLHGDVQINPHADISDATAHALMAGRLLPEDRYLAHKHNYDFQHWTAVMMQSLVFLKSPFTIADCAFGLERMDCHLVLTLK